MKKIIPIVLLAATVLAGCDKNKGFQGDLSEEESELKAAVEQYVPGVIYSIYGTLADETTDLCDLFAEAKTKAKANTLAQSDINAIAAKFLKAREYWEKSEAFLYGAASDFGIDPHIDDWPLDLNALSKTLSNNVLMNDLDTYGADRISSVGESSLGFHGLEYILFRDGNIRGVADVTSGETIVSETEEGVEESYVVTGINELIFAAAVAEDLRNACWRLQVCWDPGAPADRVSYIADELELPYTSGGSAYTYGESLLRTGLVGGIHEFWTESSTKIFVSGMQNICNEVAHTKIATANSQNEEGVHDSSYIESPYSKNSYRDFLDNILSIQYSLYGKADADVPVNASFINFLKKYNSALGDKLESALAAAKASLQACIDSGVAFVDNPAADCASNAIEKIDALNNVLGEAADYISRL